MNNDNNKPQEPLRDLDVLFTYEEFVEFLDAFSDHDRTQQHLLYMLAQEDVQKSVTLQMYMLNKIV